MQSHRRTVLLSALAWAAPTWGQHVYDVYHELEFPFEVMQDVLVFRKA